MFLLSNLDRLLSAVIITRGRNYLAQGRVTLESESDGEYVFSVIGTFKYRVSICMSGEYVTSHSCNCPYDRGICKHEAACMYYLQDKFAGKNAAQKTVIRQEEQKADYTSGIAAMPPAAQAYLCYLALNKVQTNGRLYSLPSVEGLSKLSQQKQKELNQALSSAGWLKKKIYNYYGYYNYETAFGVAPVHWMEILSFLVNERPAWFSLFQKKWDGDREADIMLRAALFLTGNRDTFEMPARKSYLEEVFSNDFLEVMQMAVATEKGKTMLPRLSDDIIAAIMDNLFACVHLEGNVRALEEVRMIFDFVPRKTDNLKWLHSVFRRDWFYYKAELLPSEEGDVGLPASFYLDAAVLLYEGKTDEALSVYAKGIRASNKLFKIKGMPAESITLLLYVIALGTRRNEADVKALQAISAKENKFSSDSIRSVFTFVDFLKDSSQYISGNIYHLLQKTSPLARYISLLFAKFVGLEGYNEAPASFGCALLQKEMSAYFENSEPGIWPYPPVVSRIKIKQKWELKLEDLIAKVSSTVADDTNEERLYYLASPRNSYTEVRLQTRLKSGKWGKGKELSLSRWYTGDCPMDDTDRAIHSQWSTDRSYNFPRLETILPFCKGTDKIYAETPYDFFPVEVREEKPYIFTERSQGKILFRTNIKSCDKGKYSWSKDCRSIVFWTVGSSSDEAVFNSLIELGSVPQEAEPMLERLFEKLKGKVEVQSDINGAVQLEKKEGSACLVVRLVPSQSAYDIQILSHPLPEGGLYLPACKGEETVIDAVGNERFEVHRNLKEEKKNLKYILETIGDDSITASSINGAALPLRAVLALLEESFRDSGRFCIEWPKGGELSLTEAKQSSWNISAKGKGGWFELEGELKVDEEQVVTAAQLLDLLRSSNTGEQQYIRLNDRQYLKLSEKIRSQLERLKAVSQTSKGKTVIPEMALTVMEDSMSDILEVSDNERLKKRRRLIREASNISFPIPDGLNATLRAYQEDGYRWMMGLSHWGAGACLADDMGLGKTVQAISFMLSKAQDGPQLVIAPASVIGNWRKEVLRFAPSLKLTFFNELPSSERQASLASLGPQCILVTTYGLLVSECKALTSINWTTAILDEAHTIKNRDTKMSSAAMKLKAANRIILTGTPIQNHLGELWNLFNFINPGLLGNYEQFQEKFVTGDSYASGAREALKRLVSPFLLRRTKNEVIKELPDKTEITVPVEMSPEEMSVYEVIRREAKAALSLGGPVSVNALAMMTKLRMASCSASLAEKDWTGGCSKLDVFIEKISAIVEGGNGVLVFSQFTSFLHMARERLEQAGMNEYLYLDGSTPVKKREKMVASFQNGEYPIFLISLKAGGLGLNLTGANYVIHLDPWWNPAIEQQATDRAYRIGQQQNVTVYHLISEGTIEEKILRLHSDKRKIAESILEGGGPSGKRLTPEELLELLEGN